MRCPRKVLTEKLSIFMHVAVNFHSKYSKEDTKNIKYYTIAEIDKSSNEKSYGALLPDKILNIKYLILFLFL